MHTTPTGTTRPKLTAVNGHQHPAPPIVTLHRNSLTAGEEARSRIEMATRAAWKAGEEEGERSGYKAGWRLGMSLGVVYGAILGGAGAMAGIKLGEWWLA